MSNSYDVYMCRNPGDKFRINLMPATFLRDYKLINQTDLDGCYELTKLPEINQSKPIIGCDLELWVIRFIVAACSVCTAVLWVSVFK